VKAQQKYTNDDIKNLALFYTVMNHTLSKMSVRQNISNNTAHHQISHPQATNQYRSVRNRLHHTELNTAGERKTREADIAIHFKNNLM
jgi:hypothetical protein